MLLKRNFDQARLGLIDEINTGVDENLKDLNKKVDGAQKTANSFTDRIMELEGSS